MPINTPTLTLTNNDDGTLTAAVSGSTASSSNAVYYAEVDNPWGDAPAWTLGDTVTGDDDAVLATGKGAFFVYCVSSLSGEYAVTSPLYKLVSNGAAAIWSQILDGIVARIRLLTLSGVAGRIEARTVLDGSFLRDVCEPKIAVGPGGALTIANEGPASIDAYRYPVTIAYAAPADLPHRQSEANRNLWLRNSELIRHALVSRPLGTATARIVRVDLRDATDASVPAWERQLLLSPLRLSALSYEARGLGV